MEKFKKILVIDDEAPMRLNISDLLGMEGYTVYEAADGESGISLASRIHPNLILLDINLPGMNGLEVLIELKKFLKDIPIIIFTAYGSSEIVIAAIKSGAFDYIEKPFDLNEFLLVVDKALNYEELVGEVNMLKSKINTVEKPVFSEEFIGRTSKMQDIFKLIGKVAPSDAVVLIEGESGTGKELIANAIQRHSLRKDKPFIKVNCGALPESLLASEIFGHEKGSFTDAKSQRIGRFELADGGTIFLDEINNMPVSLQVSLLRVLQYKTFERVGGKSTIYADVRIIASSNRDIESEVKAGRFREDLFYRLNVVRIIVPPLRERTEDIPLLIDYFIKKYSSDKGIILPAEIVRELQSYNWEGNVRELENIIHSLLILSKDGIITSDQLPKKIKSKEKIYSLFDLVKNGKSFFDVISNVEKELITKALTETGGNQTQAAKLLSINRRLLYSKIKEYNIRH